jgi:hypothetical protein
MTKINDEKEIRPFYLLAQWFLMATTPTNKLIPYKFTSLVGSDSHVFRAPSLRGVFL